MSTPALTPNIGVGAAVALSVNGTLWTVKSSKVDRKATMIKVTNQTSGGFHQFKAGIRGATFSAELVYNGDAPPTTLVEGAEVTIVFDSVGYEAAYKNPTTSPTGRLITMQVVIESVTDASQIEGDYTVSVTGNSTGAYSVVDSGTGATGTT